MIQFNSTNALSLLFLSDPFYTVASNLNQFSITPHIPEGCSYDFTADG